MEKRLVGDSFHLAFHRFAAIGDALWIRDSDRSFRRCRMDHIKRRYVKTILFPRLTRDRIKTGPIKI